MTKASLRVGAAEVNITPSVGTQMAGSLTPRPAAGVQDPLMIKAIVIESGGGKVAYVILDLIALMRPEGDAAVLLAAERTGIPADHILWAASHTHTGPYTSESVGAETALDRAYLASIPARFAEAVESANDSLQPARVSRCRGHQLFLSHNRRVLYKDGRALNTWNIGHASPDVQCVGMAGPVDPEVGILAFDDPAGNPLAVMFQYTLHANANHGAYISGDYPAVVAARLRERFGPQVVTLYVPGACGDLNSAGLSYRQVGDALAGEIIARMQDRRAMPGPVAIGADKREILVPYRDIHADQEQRLRDSGWPADCWDLFRQEQAIMRREGMTETKAMLQAWHIGDTAFASVPGELFLEWGLKIKRESSFPWTYPVELGGDCLGYLITQAALDTGGYESLLCRWSKVAPAGVGMMAGELLKMLQQLHGLARKT